MGLENREFIKDKKGIILIGIILITVIVGIFYWYEWRPAEIRKECVAEQDRRENKPGFEFGPYIHAGGTSEERYSNCLHSKGL